MKTARDVSFAFFFFNFLKENRMWVGEEAVQFLSEGAKFMMPTEQLGTWVCP